MGNIASNKVEDESKMATCCFAKRRCVPRCDFCEKELAESHIFRDDVLRAEKLMGVLELRDWLEDQKTNNTEWHKNKRFMEWITLRTPDPQWMIEIAEKYENPKKK